MEQTEQTESLPGMEYVKYVLAFLPNPLFQLLDYLLTTCAAHSLGCSGLKVSKVILGAMSYGSSEWAPWVLNEGEALPLLKAAFDRGINTWDTGEFLPAQVKAVSGNQLILFEKI